MTYVALGDSYAAGVGGGERVDACFRSRAGYPVIVAEEIGRTLAYEACSGAVVDDVRRGQLARLDSATELVTMSVGGNDAGFAEVLTACARPAWMGETDPIIDEAERVMREDLPDRLAALHEDVRSRAPQAQVVATGYPRLFAGEDCNLSTFFSPRELTRLNAAADLLAEVMGSAARAAGAVFVDVRDEFQGHAVCQDPEWIRGASWPLDESFHPNAAGHRVIADAVLVELGRQPVAAPAQQRPAVLSSRPAIAYGRPHDHGRKMFRLPDLLSPESLAGAKDSGLDADEVRRLAEAGGPDAEARLHQLDREVRAATSVE